MTRAGHDECGWKVACWCGHVYRGVVCDHCGACALPRQTPTSTG